MGEAIFQLLKLLCVLAFIAGCALLLDTRSSVAECYPAISCDRNMFRFLDQPLDITLVGVGLVLSSLIGGYLLKKFGGDR